MPELPDVEGYRRLVERHLTGTTIELVRLTDPALIGAEDPASLVASVTGRTVGVPERHGKWLTVPTDGPTIMVHLGMTGALVWTPATLAAAPAERLALVTQTGALRFLDRRRLGRVRSVVGGCEMRSVLADQGPDALTVTASSFADRVGVRKGTIKSALMNQQIVSGLGNMLSDEVLWRARLHPARSPTSLTAQEMARLHRTMRSALRSAVEAGHIPRTSGWLSSQRDADPPRCPRCHTQLQWSRIAGRSSLWCPRCQAVPPGGGDVS